MTIEVDMSTTLYGDELCVVINLDIYGLEYVFALYNVGI